MKRKVHRFCVMLFGTIEMTECAMHAQIGKLKTTSNDNEVTCLRCIAAMEKTK